ncbi:MAG: YceI family protein [Chitinophagaceae bacterium]|nr:YceI family protein [Chitinophagaceae bacterium]
MKKVLLLVFVTFLFSSFSKVNAQIWKAVVPNSQIGFTVTHIGINDITGYFKDFEVTIRAAKPNFSDAVFELTANTNSIDTRVPERDSHLKSADFFDAIKYPEISFKSTRITSVGEDRYKLHGNLTMHGVTRPVTMDLRYRGTVKDPKSNKITAAFSLRGTLNRSDFNIGTNFPDALIGNEVRILADGEFTK